MHFFIKAILIFSITILNSQLGWTKNDECREQRLTTFQVKRFIYEVAYLYAPYKEDNIVHLKDFKQRYHDYLLTITEGKELFHRSIVHKSGFDIQDIIFSFNQNRNDIIEISEQSLASESDIRVKKFFEYIRCENQIMQTEMNDVYLEMYNSWSDRERKDTHAVFRLISEYLEKRPAIWLFDANFETFLYEVMKVNFKNKYSIETLVIRLENSVKLRASDEIKKMLSQFIVEYRSHHKFTSKLEPELVAVGTSGETDPFNYLNLKKASKNIEANKKFDAIKNEEGRWIISVSTENGAKKSFLVPMGRYDLEYSQLGYTATTSDVGYEVDFYDNMFVFHPEGSNYYIYKYDKNNWKLAFAIAPALYVYNQYNLDSSQLINGFKFLSTSDWGIGIDAKGKSYFIAFSDGNFYYDSMWEAFLIEQ